jgi:hypothetical protein
MGVIEAIKLGVFIAGLLWEYGPTMVALGRKVYWKVEELLGKGGGAAERRAARKQAMFRDLMRTEKGKWRRYMGSPQTMVEVDTFREKIWERENWGKRREKKMEAIRAGAMARKAAKVAAKGK